MLTDHSIKSEKHLRDMIAKNFKKEFHPGTKPSVDFIAKLLSEAYDSGMEFDVSDLKPKMVAFAHNSSNQPVQSLRVVRDMKWKSDTGVLERVENPEAADERLVFFDVEVYKNLLIVCWKYEGDANVVKLINPDAPTIEALVTYKLVGFNNRRYDNHILYARILGYTNEDLYRLSQRLISNDRQGTFPSAYDLSYADIFDFSSVKQTLKKFQVELGLFHSEMDLSWDEPAPEDQWDRIVEYCANDVVTTEQVFLNRKGDYDARRILAALSGLPVNEGTSRHVAKILFGSDRRPSDSFKYTDLRKDFPGYEFERGKSTYRGYEVGEGGFVYAEPGVYDNVVVLDIASMHPTSIEQLNLFGKYTPNFAAIREARIAIKRGDYDAARNAFDGKLAPYLEKEEDAADLSYALKIVINTVYGLTAAKFDTPFRDKRNIDNIVAKRGALFMVDLKEFVEHELGQKVVHIKTDSIKLSNATDEEINQVFQFGEKYGYEFENEGVYERFALVNDAVYIARKNGNYEATGAQFAHPYVFKSLFTKEEIEFTDLVETKQVMGATMYLDYQHDVPLESENPDVGRMAHIGGIGQFVPVEEGEGGGVLYRYKDGKLHAVTGTKNKLWLPAEVAKDKEDLKVDVSYYEALADKAIETINKFGPYDEFIN